MNLGEKVRRTGGQGADGQLGVIVPYPEGGLGVQLDRGSNKGSEVLIVPWRPGEWTPAAKQPIPPMHLGRITYDADKALRVARGDYSPKEWPSLPEKTRIAWAQAGPPKDDEERWRLYAAIKGALG